MQVTQNDFDRMFRFIYDRFGINLTGKKHLIEGRLAAVPDEMGFKTFTEYVDYITTTRNQEDIDKLLNRITTNTTYFMRESSHFDYFAKEVLPHLERTAKNRSLAVWCAACSTGEEAYTLAIIMMDYFRNKPGWDIRLLASDISQRALSKAMQGVYEPDKISDLPAEWKKRYMKKRPDGKVEFTEDVKKNVIFRTFNLMDQIQFKSTFDVIFCRNVMIYFDAQTTDAVVRRFYGATNPGGFLFVGHSETLDRNSPYKYMSPSIYRKA